MAWVKEKTAVGSECRTAAWVWLDAGLLA